MRSTTEILDAIKRRNSIASDYALAKLLGRSRAGISSYRVGRSGMDNLTAFKAAELLGESPAKIIAIVEAERARTPEKRKKWEQIARIAVMAWAFLLAPLLATPKTAVEPLGATQTQFDVMHTLYIMRRWLARALRRLAVDFRLIPATFSSYMPRMVSIVLLAAFTNSSPAARGDDSREWSRADTAREITYLTLTTADWAQTRWMQSRNWRLDEDTILYERNPLLGRNPSKRKINTIIPLAMVAHVLIANELGPTWRPVWQYFWIAIEAGAVHHNYRVGIGMEF